MAEEGRILGLDVGDVRTGIALCDPMRIIASPFDVLQVTTPRKDAEAIRKIVEENDVVRIVAGLPLDREGGIGPQAEKVLAFLEVLREVVDVEVVTQDERFSTASAERALLQANVRRKGRKKVIDKIAAQQILQLYMDRLASEARRRT
jgi:putative Holliday junction resolvase